MMRGGEADQRWYRGRVEQLDQAFANNKVRVLSLDFGWNGLYKTGSLYHQPPHLAQLPVRCEKYKMADMKPKGQADGYSAKDRRDGANWLRRLVGDRVVVANCYRQVGYSGGIMADCMVGEDINLNKAALMQGYVISCVYRMVGPTAPPAAYFPPKSFAGGQRTIPPLGPVDLDYTTYNGKGGAVLGDGKMGTPPGRGGIILNGAGGGGGKLQDVKKLEKIISDDKKTISQLKKTTNLDAGIKAGNFFYFFYRIFF